MKKSILISCFLLAACCTPKIVEKKVYEPPVFDMPERPVLSSNGGESFNEVGKNVEKDLVDLKSYALKLENTLNELKTPKTINNNNERAK